MTNNILGLDLRLNHTAASSAQTNGLDIAVSDGGDLATVSEEQNLGQAIVHRLLTRRGELAELGHPGYGSLLHELIGEVNNERTRTLVRLYVKECIEQESRISEIVSIVVRPRSDRQDVVTVEITVMPATKSSPVNIVFPFYLEVV
jgi:phage baseplate assembly protein W